MDFFNIYIERLRGGKIEEIEGTIDPSFINISEADLSFNSPVIVHGIASLADGALLLILDVSTIASIPCAICNKEVKFNVKISKLEIIEEIKNIRSGIFNFKNELRESILLEIPSKVECQQGACPERVSVAQFLKKRPVDSENHPTYQPFIDL